ncbi:hypothetical protein B0H10DRAFT_719813 [Mycena sp. CBHHK59/15]|nr:hypothetical protein B0H10DRAFT_719813 [Mycena sp. CBHHK59/15]
MSHRYRLPSRRDQVYYAANYYPTESTPQRIYSCGHCYHPPNSCNRRSSHHARPYQYDNYPPIIQEWNGPSQTYQPYYNPYHQQFQQPSRYSYYRQ